MRGADFVVHDLVSSWSRGPGFIPYLPLWQQVIARNGDRAATVDTRAALAGLRIGVVDSDAERAVEHLVTPATPARRYATDDAAIRALLDGRVDVVVVARTAVGALLQRHSGLTSVGLLPPDHYYGMRFRPGSKLEALVARAIRRLRSYLPF